MRRLFCRIVGLCKKPLSQSAVVAFYYLVYCGLFDDNLAAVVTVYDDVDALWKRYACVGADCLVVDKFCIGRINADFSRGLGLYHYLSVANVGVPVACCGNVFNG